MRLESEGRAVAPRAYWKGYLKLSLVSCPVALFSAVSRTEKISFHLINRDTGHRLRQQYVDSVTGDFVDRDEQVRGYETGKNDYITLEETEIAEQALESTHTIDIETFVERDEIDEVYLDDSYYLAPDSKVADEPFVVIRDAIRKNHVAGLGRIVLSGRERVVLIEARDKGLLATTLHYNYEVRDEKPYFESIPAVRLSKEMLDLATHIIETKRGKFDPTKFEDRYQNALVKLIRAKRAGKAIAAPAQPKAPSNVINLMDALRRSVKGSAGSTESKQKISTRKTRTATKKSTSSGRKRIKKAS
jgi:DNA end-binding protein Ku